MANKSSLRRVGAQSAHCLALLASLHFALVSVARADVAGQMNSFFNDGVQAYAHFALTDGEIETLSEIVAVDLLAAMLDNMLDRVEQAKVHYQTFDQETAIQWKQQIAATRAKFAQRDVKLNNKLQVTMQIINRSIMLESTLQNSMTPGMASALSFSRGLNAQGLM